MGNNGKPDPPNFKKYGFPSYSVAWVPYKSIRLQQKASKDEVPEGDDNKSELEPEISATQYYIAFSGGGGEGRSGIRNVIALGIFDLLSNTLSDQPVAKLETGSDLPYRMAVHPGGDGIICAMPNSCRWFEWDGNIREQVHELGLKTSDKVLTDLENVGQQLALTFNNDGSVLAVGGEDGHLRVFKWPSMEIVLNEANAHTTVKDLDFSSDGRFLVSLGSGGPCRVWDMASSAVLASLSKEKDENFSSCRFSQTDDKTQVLYIAAVTGKGGSILTWNTNTWMRMSSKPIVRDPISTFNVSVDGKFLACGTIQGDIMILSSTNMHIQSMVRKAHLGIVTSLRFSDDSRALASVSMDGSERVTLIEDKKKSGGLSLWIMVFIILLAIAAYFLMSEGLDK
ncbi:SEC12-like protein 2 [Quillaja saponaria]|uniref:SEC12-like protein 2 n=1 Tax=Quillaja saponaria TaxID=32244 RepID=A0AAD7KP05_QUISA|nr:SEC12-like protein 2 [Quillaja saponaria]